MFIYHVIRIIHVSKPNTGYCWSVSTIFYPQEENRSHSTITVIHPSSPSIHFTHSSLHHNEAYFTHLTRISLPTHCLLWGYHCPAGLYECLIFCLSGQTVDSVLPLPLWVSRTCHAPVGTPPKTRGDKKHPIPGIERTNWILPHVKWI